MFHANKINFIQAASNPHVDLSLALNQTFYIIY